jgi:uncharacterized membrane protein
MNPSRLLPLLAIVALLLLLMAAAMLAVGRGAPALGAHIAFALGVMPLILAAMGVLRARADARSGRGHRRVAATPAWPCVPAA